MKKQDFKVLKTKDLYPFPDNPFHVAEDETLSELAESIKEFGIVTPIITRPKEDGDGYEVIAGQRRVRASELAGINTVPAFVLPLDRDRAIITLVDSNLQRENILPSERAFAYKMKSEAMKRQGFRTDLTSSQVVTKLRTDDKVAQGFGVLVTSCDEVADGRQGGTGLRRGQDDRAAFYPPDGTDTADFADGGRGENRPHACGGTVLLEERRAGKPLCHDGERRSNALTLTGTADETVKPERAA